MVPRKPSESEEEYFARIEAEKKKKREEEKLKAEERYKREQKKQLHWMKCPKCGMDLEEKVFKGVSVDQCTSCKGVWLDPGEIELLAGKESSIIEGFLKYFKK